MLGKEGCWVSARGREERVCLLESAPLTDISYTPQLSSTSLLITSLQSQGLSLYICHNLNQAQRPLQMLATQSVSGWIYFGEPVRGSYQFNLNSLVIWEALFHVTGKLAGERIPSHRGWGQMRRAWQPDRGSQCSPEMAAPLSVDRKFEPHCQEDWGHEGLKSWLSGN